MKKVSDGVLLLCRVRLMHKMQTLAVERFVALERTRNFTIDDLGHRIMKDRKWVLARLSGEKLYTLEDFSDIVLGMGCEPRVWSIPIKSPSWWKRLWWWWLRVAVPTIRSWNPGNAPTHQND